MGTSTNGLLVFGFDLGEDVSAIFGEDDKDQDFEEFITKEAEFPEWVEGVSSDYWKERQGVIDACPVDLVTHCSYDYPMNILAIRGKKVSALRGYPEAIDPDFLKVEPEKIEAAKDWCQKHNVEWQDPKWLLASLWG